MSLIRRSQLHLVVALVSLALPLAFAGAQVVRGSVTEEGTGAPLPGVLLSLLTADGEVTTSVLSDERGSFALRAPGPGRYALEAKRIGVKRSTGSAFDLGAGETRAESLSLGLVAIVQREVRVTDRTECVVRPSDNVRTADLWDDVRAALTATQVSRRDRIFKATVAKFVRTLHPRSLEVVDEQRVQTTSYFESALWSSRPAAELSRRGYVQRERDGTRTFFAPDAAVMLSSEFIDDHCFRVQRGTGHRAGMIGLAFEPLAKRRVPDVRGVLWLDSLSSELRALDFRYTGLEPMKGNDKTGGQVVFARLPSGAWMVQRWYIRMPIVEQRLQPGTGIPGAPAEVMRERLTGMREEGGEAKVQA